MSENLDDNQEFNQVFERYRDTFKDSPPIRYMRARDPAPLRLAIRHKKPLTDRNDGIPERYT